MSEQIDAAVVLPAWNGERTIEQALQSIEVSAERTRRSVIIVVVDDASTDDTTKVVDRFALRSNNPVVLVRHESNLGTGAGRNSGVAAVDASAYLFLDQDDQFLPDHIDRCVRELGAHRQCDYVRTGVLLDRPVHPEWHEIIADSLVQAICVRSFAHRLIGGFIDDEAVAIVGCDDVYYRRLLASFLRGRRIPEATVRFRDRPGNSFSRQWVRKFSRSPAEAEATLVGPRLAALPAAEAAFAARVQEVEARVRRLTGR